MADLIVFEGLTGWLFDVMIALVPLLAVLLLFKLIFKIEITNLYQLAIGILFAVIGLALFLHGVHIGFFPMGKAIGETLGGSDYKWVLIPIGFVLGIVATIAEPAVRVLNYEVEKVSSGSLKGKLLLVTLALGVGVFVALAMMRILYSWPLWSILVPGYVLAFILTKFTSSKFVSIGFDAGGVATGPMTVTFILALAVGVANVMEGRDPLIDGFGLVALVALAPILSILILGIIYEHQLKKSENHE